MIMGHSEILAAACASALIVFYVVVIVLEIAGMWQIFKKAGKPGWAAIIPIYNVYVLLKIVGRPWWWLLLFLIPFVGLGCEIIVANDVSKSFGRSTAFTVGLVLLSFIFFPILGFGASRY